MNNNKEVIPFGYNAALAELILKINKARYTMIKRVNAETVRLYWQIGKIVSRKIESEGWGNSIVERLSKDLQAEYPGIKGFSTRNIWRMKSFYETYISNSKMPPVVAEIGWVQNCLLIEKCKNSTEREFYIQQIKSKGWSKNDLLEKIEAHYYQNQMLSQNNFEATVSEDLKARVGWEFIDDYNIEIINPDQPIAEKELENSIIRNIVRFLDEMGGNFAFIGRQCRIEYRGQEYFIDLMFFNIKLNCYVVFELKAREFSPKDLGQLQFIYLQLIKRLNKKYMPIPSES